MRSRICSNTHEKEHTLQHGLQLEQPNCKQPRRSSLGHLLNQLWCILTMEYSAAMKNEWSCSICIEMEWFLKYIIKSNQIGYKTLCTGHYTCVKVKRFTITQTHSYMLECTCITSQRIYTCHWCRWRTRESGVGGRLTFQYIPSYIYQNFVIGLGSGLDIH